MDSALEQKLEKIRSPKLQSQSETRVVLSAVEDTLQNSKSERTPTAYFSALLSLLDQFISTDKQIVNKDVATSIVYLLDVITPSVPAPLLRSKFAQILQKLATALTHKESDAPLLRPSIGCLESLLIVQDSQAWALPANQISPRRAVAGLLTIAVDHRPKVRKRALEAITKVLKSPPPSPSLDHPAADMCAETSLRTLADGVEATKKHKKHSKDINQHTPSLMHALQLVKTVANASGGWPSRKLDALCDALLSIARSSNEYLTTAAFEVFEVIFAGMTDEVSSAKLPHLLDILNQLQPSAGDAQLLPPWMAVVSRGYDIYSQVEPEEAFDKLPNVFAKISEFLTSPAHNIRISASECLISLLVNCIPASVILEPSIMDEKTLEKVSKHVTALLNVKYQSAWQEVFQVVAAAFENLRWRSSPALLPALKAVGDLRTLESFNGKKEADDVIGKAITAMGPDAVLEVLPLNMASNTNQGGRAWLLPILRVSVRNTKLSHFRSELGPVSEKMFQKVLDHGNKEKTMEIKIYETVVHQIWSCLPGYCDLPIDLREAFDQSFAELISNLLYQKVELRSEICKALQLLVESNKSILLLEDDDKTLPLFRVSKDEAKQNLEHLAGFSSNILAVLFNVYTQTLPTYRGPVLQCIDAYLGIILEGDLVETFTRVTAMLESSLSESDKTSKPSEDRMPPMSHTLMDLVITIAAYLPRASLATLFNMAFVILQRDDPNLQKKAYKLIPRLSESEIGMIALQERSDDLQNLLLQTAANTQAAAKRHRLSAVQVLITNLPPSDLYFVPAILPEVVLCTKEANEKTRGEAFDLLVTMGDKIKAGGTIQQSKIPNMSDNAPPAAASLPEFFTMVSAGLAGSVPHSISATILALTRILHQFHEELDQEMIKELVETVNIFLKNPNREIVRSALGFSKVCIISLDKSLIQPMLKDLIPTFLMYSKEHKGHLQAKVKHIFERLIGKFGYSTVEKFTPADDHKLIANIRKRKERAKKKKRAGADDEDETMSRSASPEAQRKKQGKFESEYDEAVYGSGDDSDASASDVSDDELLGRQRHRGKGNNKKGETYIVEDEDEPLDLLDKRALGHISSTKPVKARQPPTQKRKAKTDLDGKLVFGDDDAADGGAEMDEVENDDGMDLESGINAYVAAIKGRDVGVRKGRAGKIKFTNKREKAGDGDEMDVDEDDARNAFRKKASSAGQARGGGGGGLRGRAGGGGMKAARMQRRGLGSEKTRGGRVVKSPRGKPSFRR